MVRQFEVEEVKVQRCRPLFCICELDEVTGGTCVKTLQRYVEKVLASRGRLRLPADLYRDFTTIGLSHVFMKIPAR